MLTPRTFNKIIEDIRVADYSDERTHYMHHEGIWLYLAPGWVTGYGDITIHEYTVKECAYELMCTRYSPDEWRQALQAQQAHELQNVELLPAG